MNAEMGSEPSISDSEYQQFCEFFYSHTGIRFSKTKRYFVDKRVVDRIKISGFKGFAEYFKSIRLSPHGAEVQSLVDAMTVNETYFYREIEQLDVLIREVLPVLCEDRRDGEAVRILSLPCSSGEEVYSIALKLLEEWPDVDRYDINLFGADIDSKMVEKARQGAFSERSIQKLSSSITRRYFQKERTEWRILEELRESVDLRCINILDRKAMMRFVDIDVLFCRNMLIYFDDVSRRKAVDALYDALRPGGVLFVGMSESLGRTTRSFDVVRNNGLIVYKKPRRRR